MGAANPRDTFGERMRVKRQKRRENHVKFREKVQPLAYEGILKRIEKQTKIDDDMAKMDQDGEGHESNRARTRAYLKNKMEKSLASVNVAMKQGNYPLNTRYGYNKRVDTDVTQDGPHIKDHNGLNLINNTIHSPNNDKKSTENEVEKPKDVPKRETKGPRQSKNGSKRVKINNSIYESNNNVNIMNDQIIAPTTESTQSRAVREHTMKNQTPKNQIEQIQGGNENQNQHDQIGLAFPTIQKRIQNRTDANVVSAPNFLSSFTQNLHSTHDKNDATNHTPGRIVPINATHEYNFYNRSNISYNSNDDEENDPFLINTNSNSSQIYSFPINPTANNGKSVNDYKNGRFSIYYGDQNEIVNNNTTMTNINDTYPNQAHQDNQDATELLPPLEIPNEYSNDSTHIHPSKINQNYKHPFVSMLSTHDVPSYQDDQRKLSPNCDSDTFTVNTRSTMVQSDNISQFSPKFSPQRFTSLFSSPVPKAKNRPTLLKFSPQFPASISQASNPSSNPSQSVSQTSSRMHSQSSSQTSSQLSPLPKSLQTQSYQPSQQHSLSCNQSTRTILPVYIDYSTNANLELNQSTSPVYSNHINPHISQQCHTHLNIVSPTNSFNQTHFPINTITTFSLRDNFDAVDVETYYP